MPTIRPYQPQVQPQGALGGRQASGSDFGGDGIVNLGQSMVAAGMDFARADAVLEQAKARREATDADIQLTELHTEAMQEIHRLQQTWQPGEPLLSEQMSGYLRNRLDTLSGGEDTSRYETAAGQATFRTRAAKVTASIMEGLISVDASLQGKAAQMELDKTLDSTANLLQNNPNMFLFKRTQVQEMIDNPNGLFARLDPAARAKVQQGVDAQLAVSAVQGFIRQRPNLALEVLTDPELRHSEHYGWISKYIPSEKLAPLIEHTRVAAHVQEQAAKNAEADYAKAIENAALSQQAFLVQQYLLSRADPKAPKVTPLDMIKADVLMSRHPEKLLALQGVLDQDAREAREGASKGDPGVARALFAQIAEGRMPDIAPINAARARGALTPEQHKELIGEFNDARTPDGRSLAQDAKLFFDRMEPAIMPKNLTGVLADPESGARMLKYEQDVRAQMARDRKEGKDPYLRLNANAPEYMGTPEVLSRYQVPFMDAIKNAARRMTEQPGLPKTPEGGVPDDKKRRPGETAEDYLRRIEK